MILLVFAFLILVIAIRLLQHPIKRGLRFKGDSAIRPGFRARTYPSGTKGWRKTFRGGGCE